MEKIKQHKLAIIVALILFFIPFFWLKAGVMDLGGDAGRLYFYDPASVLKLAFYNYTKSGTGGEVVNYIYLPYVTILFLLKLILQSPTVLISFFNGITLSVSFFSVYLIVRELLSRKENAIRKRYIELASIFAGLFYILSQISIYSGWDRPIITFNQVFLNPLMAFLLLKLMLTQRIKYLIIALCTTFIFAPNFSLIGAPQFFAFYPVTIIFIFIYAKFVRKVSFKRKLLAIGIILFLLIHAFHLVNEVGGIGSIYSKTIFSQTGTGSRDGLNFFISVANNLEVSRIWMSLAQFQYKSYFAIFIIFPLILVISFFINRGKTLLLTGLFFLIIFFFTSAVTETGLFFYKQLFRIPGFSMFRNFHAQWIYVFSFFYALLLGQSLAIIANKISKRMVFFLFVFLGVIIFGFGLPLLNGTVSMHAYDAVGIRLNFKMDPIYEKVIKYFQSSSIEARTLVFPLTGNGYQIFQGKDGGIYQGLPTISYLMGKFEISGYETLRPFQDIFLNAMQNNNYVNLNKLLSILNVKWVFYNSDPNIYNQLVKPFFYNFVSDYSPKNQDAYKAFIEKLPITNLVNFGDKYHIYSVNGNAYLPHIFSTNSLLYSNDQLSAIFDSNLQKDTLQFVGSVIKAKTNKDQMAIYGIPKPFLLDDIHDNNHLHRHMPFLNQKLDSPTYFFTVLRENFNIMLLKNNPTQYLDYSLLLLSKRIAELNIYGQSMPVTPHGSKIWNLDKLFSYNSWDISFNRYETQANQVINWINDSNFSYNDKMYDKLKINEQFHQHELSLLHMIYDLSKKDSEKKYLLNYVDDIFARLYKKIDFPIIDPSLYTYQINSFPNREGNYEIFFQNNLLGQNQEQAISIGDKILKTPFNNVHIDSQSQIEVDIKTPTLNLASGQKWENSGISMEEADNSTTLEITSKLGDLTGGLSLEIPSWTEKNIYLITFDYNTYGDDFVFSFVEKYPNDSIKKFVDQSLFEKRLNSKNFKTHQSVVFSDGKSIGGFLKIVPFSSKNINNIKIKNLVIQKIEYPKLVLRKITPENNNQLLPNITFKEINPTRYIVSVKGAVNPYTLVFLEAFNADWKLFNSESNTNSLGGWISRSMGQVGKLLVNFFVNNKSHDKVIASYSNDKVKENAPENILLDPKTFDTWGKNVIADSEHTIVDGYANAWYIRPEDLGGKTNYSLILELKTQKQFYPSFFISLLTIVSLLLYSAKRFLWPKK